MRKTSIISLAAAMLTAVCLTGCFGGSNQVEIEYLPVQLKEDGKWSFMTPEGKIILENEFKNEPTAVVEGMFSVRKGDEGYALYSFDEKKPEIVDGCEKLSHVGVCVDGLIPVTKPDSRISVINRSGKEQFVLNPIKDQEIVACYPDFSEGLLAVKNAEGLWGYVDTKGKTVIEPKYSDVTRFSEGFAVVQKEQGDGQYIVIKTDGSTAFKLKSDYSSTDYTFTDGILFCRDSDDACGWYNTKGEFHKCPSKVKRVYAYNDKVYIYRDEDNQYGVMDYDGEAVIRAKYDNLQLLSDGNYLTHDEDDKTATILNDKGEKIATVEDVEFIGELPGFGLFGKNKSWQMYNLKGEEVKDAEFKGMNPSSSASYLIESEYFDADVVAGKIADLFSDNGVGQYRFGASAASVLGGEPSYSETYAKSKKLSDLSGEGYGYSYSGTAYFSDYAAQNHYDYYYSSSISWNPNAKIDNIDVNIETERKACVKLTDALVKKFKDKGFSQIAANTPKHTNYIVLLKKGNVILAVGGEPKGNSTAVMAYYDPTGVYTNNFKQAVQEIPLATDDNDSDSSFDMSPVEIADSMACDTAVVESYY